MLLCFGRYFKEKYSRMELFCYFPAKDMKSHKVYFYCLILYITRGCTLQQSGRPLGGAGLHVLVPLLSLFAALQKSYNSQENGGTVCYPQSRAGVRHLTLLTPNGQRWACFNNNSASRRRKAMVTVNSDSVKFISATLAVSVFHPLIMDHSMVRSSQTKPDITDSLSRAGKQT